MQGSCREWTAAPSDRMRAVPARTRSIAKKQFLFCACRSQPIELCLLLSTSTAHLRTETPLFCILMDTVSK